MPAHLLSRSCAAIAACLAFAAAMVVSPTTARAATPAVGYDVSWPQCGGTLPPSPLDVAVIGVTGGYPFSANPCLTTEFGWAEAGHYPPALYVNTNWPTAATVQYGASGPAGNCASGDLLCWGYNYGWNTAQDAVHTATSKTIDGRMWWLDVETTNNWSTNVPANARDIQGAIDYLRATGRTVGVYSTGYQWHLIVGSFLPGVPVWSAGASDINDAASRCGDASFSFTGGAVWLVQYPSGTYDGDYGCTNEPGWESSSPPPAGINLAVPKAGSGAAAVAIDNVHIYARLSTGSGFADPPQTWSSQPFYGTLSTRFANLDGTGGADSAVAINASSIWVEKNVGGSLGPPTEWSSAPFYGTRATLLADVDGSGRASAVAINDSSVWVMLNTGASFGPPQQWSTNQPFYGSRLTTMAVVDGSHRASVVAVNDRGLWVLPNVGGRFGAPQAWASYPFYGSRGTFFGDVDGSGRASAIAMNDQSIYVAPNSGTASFGTPVQWSGEPFYGQWNYGADLDGKGKVWMVAVNESSIWVKQNVGGAFGPATNWLSTPFYGTH